ncbi:hypothetical protein PN498_12720 [Oscillatoria sp. CS-180]|uniref:hypothetical protein n=1 Tax=Oscillatoria sp. CS-180 TaxID=3021720 RepID=UPI00232B9A0C|nr:hypothetical protein [Oscillatoria sp. CS-180]MDB9526855.1 hypothetical protein [Oscillatoria sp. CS-180]
MDTAFEAQTFTVLAVLAAALLLLVTGGVIYLTAVDWRDRRRRQREQQANKPRISPKNRKKKK